MVKFLDDDSYRELQNELMDAPESGKLIRHSHGLRKIRWKVPGRGKSGGIRIIYYLVNQEEIFLLYAYAKNAQENLSPEQAKRLQTLVDKHLAT